MSNLLLIPILIAINCFFIIAEVSLLAVRRTKIEKLSAENNRLAKLLKKAIQNINPYIITAQVGSTAVTVALGWFGQPLIEQLLGHSFILSSYTPALSVLLAFLIITSLQLIFGEIMPRTLAISDPEKFGLIFIAPLTIFMELFKPLALLLNLISEKLLSIFGIKNNTEDNKYSEKEIKIILALSHKFRVISDSEKVLASNVFKLKKMALRKIMLQREKLVCFSCDDYIVDIRKKILENGNVYNRYPVYIKSPKKIIGFFHVSDVFNHQHAYDNKKINTTDFLHKVLYISDKSKTDKVVLEMKEKQTSVGVVINKKGESLGLITLTDIMKRLV